MTRLKAALKLIKRANIFFCNNHEVSDNRSSQVQRASKVSNNSGLFCQKLSKSLLEAFVKLSDLLFPGLFGNWTL
jgi:hypothetical protein